MHLASGVCRGSSSITALLCPDQHCCSPTPRMEVVTMPTNSRQYGHIVHRATVACTDSRDEHPCSLSTGTPESLTLDPRSP